MTNTTKPKTALAIQLEKELQHFTGDLVRYRHPMNSKVIYSPSVRHLAEPAEAYWLVDDIAIVLGSEEFRKTCENDFCISEMHFWNLKVNREQVNATLWAEADSDVDPFYVRNIEFTDFPLDEICIWAAFDGSHWVLYLPSEH